MGPNFIRRNVTNGLIFLLALLVLSFVLGVYFETHIQELADYFIKEYHPIYLFLFIFLNDVIISPIPPDLFLVLLTKVKNYPNLGFVVLGMGVASTLAGIFSWYLASTVIKAEWLGKKFLKYMSENEEQMRKFGKWMLALGALTPVPYSMTCWAAGIIKVDYKIVLMMTSLRIIRFVGYFYLLLLADSFI